MGASGRQIQNLETTEGDERAQLHRLLDAAPDAMVVVGADGRIVTINAQVEKLFGYQSEELLGMKVEVLVPERFRGRDPDHRARFLKSRASGQWAPTWNFTVFTKVAASSR